MFEVRKLITLIDKYSDLRGHRDQLLDAIAELQRSSGEKGQCLLSYAAGEAGVFIPNATALPYFQEDLGRTERLLSEMSSIFEKTGL